MERRRNEAGNTIITVLVALGLASVVIFTLATVFSDAYKNQRSITQSVAAEQEASLLIVALSRQETCTQALLKNNSGNLINSRTPGAVRSGISFTELLVPQSGGGTVRLARTYTTSQCNQPANAAICNGVVLSSIELGPKRNPAGADISQLTPNFMLGEISLTFRKSGSVTGANVITRKVPVGLSIDTATGRITACQSTGGEVTVTTPTPTPTPTAEPPKRRCSPPIYSNIPWMKERIYCRMPNGQVSVLYFAGDSLKGADNVVIYTSPHGNQPLTVKYNASNGSFLDASGGPAQDGGSCLGNNLRNIVKDSENQCAD